MAGLGKDIAYKLSRLNVLEKLIAVNVVIFLVGLLFPTLITWLQLPSQFNKFILKPWSIVTYAFAHYDIWHIGLNMLVLYFLANMLLNLFSYRMALNIYFLGAIAGGIFYLLFYSFLPNSVSGTPVVGASAAVRAILIFLCAYMPNSEVRIIAFNVKLKYVGVAIVVLDLIGIVGDNGGGHLAHLGGVVLGYIYATQLTKGKDIGKGFEKQLGDLGSALKFKKKSPLKTVHKNKSKVGGYTKADFNAFSQQKKVDVILDKISKSGYESLTAEEKDFLFRAGK